MKLTPKKFNYALTGLFIAIVVGGIGLTVYASTWLKTRSENIVTLKLDSLVLEEQRKTAIRASSELEEYKETRESISKIVPKSKDQAKAIAELQRIAQDVGATIGSITFPTSELGAAAPKAAAPATTSGTSAPSTPSPTPAPATPSITQAKPVEGLTGILGVEVTVSQIDSIGAQSGTGMSYPQLIEFLRALEKNRRTMQVKLIQVQPLKGPKDSEITGYSLTLNLNIFVKP
jgi:hypothetical protein